MEAYIETHVEEVEEAEGDSMITLDDMEFNGKTLQEYENLFSIKFPAIPCTGHEILGCISGLANAYQLAYNNYSRLMIVCAKSGKDYKIKRDGLITAKVTALRALNPGKPTKLPSKETIEAMVISESDELSSLVDDYKKWEVIKDWFEAHVKKLGHLLTSAKDISYAVHNGERMYSKGNV